MNLSFCGKEAGMILWMGLLLAPLLAGSPPQGSGSESPEVPTGPGVGDQVPSFRLADQHGHMQDLNSCSGPRGAMLVFFRSADW